MWLDGYERVALGQTGGSYDRRDNPKLCWHTTEGGSLAGAEAAFYPYPPHLGVDPDTGERHQYIDLDRRAYSLGNSDAEDSYVIQVEVVGFASDSHTWSTETLRWLGDNVADPVAAAVGVPPVIAPQGFHGQGEGIVLASSSSPIRFDIGGWDAFAGHVGHQHCPGDDHWDPGALDVATILTATAPTPKEEDMTPSVLAVSDGRVFYFATGTNREVWAKVAGVSDWYSLGGESSAGVDATQLEHGEIRLVIRGTDGALWAKQSNRDGDFWGAQWWSEAGGLA